MKKTMSFIIILLVFLTLIYCSRSTQTEENSSIEESSTDEGKVGLDGESLLEERCTKCHNLDRVYPKAYNAEEWEEVVDRMIDHGAKLNDEEREILLDNLILE